MRKSKHEISAESSPNHILLQDIWYGCSANKNAKNAIYSSISMKISRVDIPYIEEKISIVKDIQNWLPKYIKEAEKRIASSVFSEDEIKKFNDAIELSYFK